MYWRPHHSRRVRSADFEKRLMSEQSGSIGIGSWWWRRYDPRETLKYHAGRWGLDTTYYYLWIYERYLRGPVHEFILFHWAYVPEKEKCSTKIHPYLRVWSIWAWHLKENFVRRVRARRMLLMIQPYNASDHDTVRMMLHLSTCHLLLQARGSRSALPGLWKTEPSYHFSSSYFYDEFHCRPWTFEPWLNPFIFTRIGLPGVM